MGSQSLPLVERAGYAAEYEAVCQMHTRLGGKHLRQRTDNSGGCFLSHVIGVGCTDAPACQYPPVLSDQHPVCLGAAAVQSDHIVMHRRSLPSR